MDTRTRICIGISCYFITLCLVIIDIEAVYPAAIFFIAGTRALWKEWVYITTALWRKAGKRANKVAKKRRCALCSAPPIYMLHLIEMDGTEPISPFAGRELHVCRAHHPNEKIGPKADELHQLIKQMGGNLTYDRVYPYTFYEM
jgi:hypothetical protein